MLKSALKLQSTSTLFNLARRSISFTKVDARPVTKQEKEEEKKVCDPFNNQGKPFDEEVVRRFMALLSPKWVYNTEKKMMSRAFDFKPSYAKMDKSPEVRVPGSTPYSTVTGPGGCFDFASKLNNVCTNTDHWVYNVSITPRKSEVEVQLKTISRGGITQADINIAIQLDMLMKTTYRVTRDTE